MLFRSALSSSAHISATDVCTRIVNGRHDRTWHVVDNWCKTFVVVVGASNADGRRGAEAVSISMDVKIGVRRRGGWGIKCKRDASGCLGYDKRIWIVLQIFLTRGLGDVRVGCPCFKVSMGCLKDGEIRTQRHGCEHQ